MWSRIIGHKRQIEQLRRALAAGRLPNAYIFSGPAGIGKRLTADALAAASACPNAPAAGWEACEACPACRKIASGNHPDLFAIQPEESERGAITSIRIETLRELTQKLMYAPLEARAKVAIIDGADRLLPQAANSLLKCLEEPPKATHFILITPLPHKLLPTIRSRCQHIAFSPLPEGELAEHIARTRSIEISEAHRVARLSGGSMGLALSLDPDFVGEVLGRFLPLFPKAASADIMETAQAFKSLGQERMPFIFDILASWYGDMLRYQTTGESGDAIHPEVAGLAGNYPRSRVMGALAKINAARLAADTAVNKQLMFEDLLFTLTG